MNTDHYLKRLRAGLRPDTNSLVRFIQDETYLNLKPYSFKGHEYQQYFVELIEKDQNVDITAEKCSQIGLSEICFRISLGLMALHPGYAVAYLMPSVSLSNEVLKTRMNSIIMQSPALRALISKDVDSASVKMFTSGSILFALGASASSGSTLINRPISLALTDEMDRCSKNTHTGLRSRQKHSVFGKPCIAVSTPTAPDIGINAEAKNRQLHYQIIVCPYCKHEFKPDYYEQIRLPGFDDPIETLTAEKLRSLNLDTTLAYHECPSCKRDLAGIGPDPLKWVIENGHLTGIHLRISPFAASAFVTPADLVASQLKYSSRVEFENQELGLPARLVDSSIDVSKIRFTNDDTPEGIRVAGLDLGKVSHWAEGVISTSTAIFVDTINLLDVEQLETEVSSSINLRSIASIVSDALPFLPLIHRWCNRHPQLWPAYYVDPIKPMPELYKLKTNTEEVVRQVSINKNLMFDSLAEALMTGAIVFRHSQYDSLLTQHIGAMRRVRDYKYAELRYKWVKPDKGEDHLWHTLCYLFMASKLIRQGTHHSLTLPTSHLFNTFNLRVDL